MKSLFCRSCWLRRSAFYADAPQISARFLEGAHANSDEMKAGVCRTSRRPPPFLRPGKPSAAKTPRHHIADGGFREQ